MALRIEHLPERDARFERFSGTEPRPSEVCPECDAPPFRPHSEGCPDA